MDDSCEPSTSNEVSERTPTTYVADQLEEKIRESSRLRMRSSASNDQLMHPDPKILDDLESSSRRIASNIDQVVRELRGSLHGMSDLVVEATQSYQSGIYSACETADAHIRNTYAMMAKVEELNGQLEKVTKTARQIREMRRTVEMFEAIFKE